jgi:hypothetical protein
MSAIIHLWLTIFRWIVLIIVSCMIVRHSARLYVRLVKHVINKHVRYGSRQAALLKLSVGLATAFLYSGLLTLPFSEFHAGATVIAFGIFTVLFFASFCTLKELFLQEQLS